MRVRWDRAIGRVGSAKRYLRFYKSPSDMCGRGLVVADASSLRQKYRFSEKKRVDLFIHESDSPNDGPPAANQRYFLSKSTLDAL